MFTGMSFKEMTMAYWSFAAGGYVGIVVVRTISKTLGR